MENESEPKPIQRSSSARAAKAAKAAKVEAGGESSGAVPRAGAAAGLPAGASMGKAAHNPGP